MFSMFREMKIKSSMIDSWLMVGSILMTKVKVTGILFVGFTLVRVSSFVDKSNLTVLTFDFSLMSEFSCLMVKFRVLMIFIVTSVCEFIRLLWNL